MPPLRYADSTPMDISDWHTCPNCGLPNIPERTFCKGCRTRLAGIPTPPAAATGVTGTLYTSVDSRRQLFLSSSALDYRGPGITICSAWGNIESLLTQGMETYLWLHTPATVTLVRSSDPATDAWLEHAIPLRCFGYPNNQDLLADLHRFAPQLWPRHPQTRYKLNK